MVTRREVARLQGCRVVGGKIKAGSAACPLPNKARTDTRGLCVTMKPRCHNNIKYNNSKAIQRCTHLIYQSIIRFRREAEDNNRAGKPSGARARPYGLQLPLGVDPLSRVGKQPIRRRHLTRYCLSLPSPKAHRPASYCTAGRTIPSGSATLGLCMMRSSPLGYLCAWWTSKAVGMRD
jgi:hypothetical protein